MKAYFKKSLAVLLSAMLFFASVPFAATAAEVAPQEQSVGASSGTTGGCTWTLNNGNLTISGNGAMGNYDYIYSNDIWITTAPWGANIKTVVIEDGVTSIGDLAFSGCTGLTSVTIPDSVTSIGDGAFYCCTVLTSVTIGNGVTSIGSQAFYECTGLTSVTIGNSVTSIGSYAFYDCTGLTSVHISDIAAWCNIAFSGYDSNPLYYAHDLYLNDILVTDLIIPDSVTSIGSWTFLGCTGLTSITVDLDNSVYDSRNNCNAIIETATNELVFGCKTTVIPDSVTSIGNNAFMNCTGLTSINIPNSVTSIGGYAFENCTGLTSVYIPDSVTSIGNRALGYYYNNGYKKVAGFTIYGKQGSEAQRYASDNGFIFVSEYCMVSGISNYCQAVEARKIEVGDTVAVTFKVPEDFTIVDIQWGLNYDNDMLELTGINSFDNEIMLVNSNAESYDVIGSYTDISTPVGVAKDGELVTFNFTVKQEGETTVDLNVVDMTIRIYGEDQILVENGEKKNIGTHKTTRTIPGYPATCTQAGLTDEIVCAECEKVLIKAEVIPAKGHTPVADQGKAATCTETGLTEGSHCSVCNEVLVEQIEIPALGHLPIIDPYLAPTCTHEGHTIGSFCERCGEVYVASETIPKLPHTVVVDEAVEPSCGHTGLTEGSHCSACGEVIVAQEVIPALTHQYEIVPAVPATYTKEGSTDGVRCKLCGEWLIEPQATPKKMIDFTFGDVNEDGKVNIRDVTAVQRFLAEYTDLTERQRGAADVNFDGVVNIEDVTHLQRYLAEYDVQLG